MSPLEVVVAVGGGAGVPKLPEMPTGAIMCAQGHGPMSVINPVGHGKKAKPLGVARRTRLQRGLKMPRDAPRHAAMPFESPEGPPRGP